MRRGSSTSTPLRPHARLVVLAGGRSRRFRGDKLAARIGGTTVLGRVVFRLRGVAPELVVAVASPRRATEVRRLVAGGTVLVLDRPARWGVGPAGAIGAAVEAAADRPVMIVPGDIPWITASTIRRLVSEGAKHRADLAVPGWADGELEHLLQWHRRGASSVASVEIRGAGFPVRRASDFVRAAERTVVVPVASLTSTSRALAHVTYRSDLRAPPVRGPRTPRGRIQIIEGVPKRFHREAFRLLQRGRGEAAARSFAREADWYESAGFPRLARHARDDAAGALGTVNAPDRVRRRR